MQLAHALPWIQVALAAILIVLVLIQRNSAGVGAAFGGGDSSLHYTRRGAEKIIFITTIIVGTLFALSVLAASFIASAPVASVPL
ncbi:MAG: preprotein translocase subunit SecG [Candidatus Yonathbacteria bacterium RIFOXYC1_FULL_52_10]|uniref:Protein-export membrane protein SecG n=1 Tax=Candidatus Yonathbacteria bacterium RIFOXYD1_FULL_52_36 TaxID=1802730 RepID=A0A1G2SIW0_9BACT|nr:MAG: preprotein translocase subunit SecG [Candidatus Yonathbacteria bacterium RIFOXYD1_FULL_52_36]OHA85001.1 MAG: preprotein translocase subunit SecG [Candidatus Yonathbacteria bacterium RIFOXYC1_FULL_52_10]